MKRPSCYLILTILIFIGEVHSQDWHSAGDAERASIEKSLEKRLHSECGILDFVLVDSVLEPLDAESGGFEDPRGLLRDCYVLMFARSNPRTDAETKSSIAIYKRGKIIGLVDTVIGSSTCTVKTIADINRDGGVEIVVAVVEGISAGKWETYWIFSWNGGRLRVINAVDRATNRSVILAPWDYLAYKDVDGDGVYELVTSFEDEKGFERQHIYSWNGKLYGEWGKSSKALLKKPSKKRK